MTAAIPDNSHLPDLSDMIGSGGDIHPLRFAAIDIGSNAIRLLFAHVYEWPTGSIDVRKVNLIRMPVRLGDDAFLNGMIGEERERQLQDTMTGFSYLIRAFDPISFMACGTSAMRESKNGADVAARILEKTGISIEIIDGTREAEYIFSNHIAEQLPEDRAYLYIDVGGGSTELTVFANHMRLNSESFNIGTLRVLDGKVPITEWDRMKEWVANNTRLFARVTAIGSGGNINKIYGLAELKDKKPLTFKKFKEIFEFLNRYSYDQRIRVLGMKPDRADVIVPASDIYLNIMKWGGIKEILVPQIGLSDGIIHVLYENWKKGNN